MRRAESTAVSSPSEDEPLRKNDDPVRARWVELQVRLAQKAPADELPELPNAAEFPGDADDARQVIRQISVDGNYLGRNVRYRFSNPTAAVWRSTGLYAQPGTPVTIEFEQPVGPGMSVLVGCHTDQLWAKDEWTRYPVITRTWPVREQRVVVGNAFGGPIYIRFAPGSELGRMTATVTGAIEMPLYRSGETDERRWRAEIRSLPAPWAELAGRSLIVTVPSQLIRELDNPQPIVDFWDAVMDLAADLAGIARDRKRIERFVVDRQLSGGWMHSGYPLMAHLESAADFVEIDRIREEGAWGPFHEVGHNHQLFDWVLPGSVESSVNLWSVFIGEQLLQLDRSMAHEQLTPDQRAARLTSYVDSGAPFASWTVWTALETYLQLQSAFGWQFYQDLFVDYLDIPNSDAPTEDADRIDEWLVRSSQRAGVNLAPFYESWGFAISARVSDAVSDLPEWLENPMLAD